MILNQGTYDQSSRAKNAGMKVGAIVMMLLGVAAAFGTSRGTVTYHGPVDEVNETISPPLAERVAADVDGIAREASIHRGDTVSSLLSKLGIHDEALLAFLYADRKADQIFRQLAPGKSINALVLPDGKLHSLTFPLNGDGMSVLQVSRGNDGFLTQANPLSFDKRLVSQSSTINSSLFEATDAANIPDDIAIELADIFSGDIDFHRDLRKGDSFTVIYEVNELLGKPLNSNRILAAEFINDGKLHQAFWHQHDDGKGGYYAADGSSLRKAFLRSPLEFSRITSGFSRARYHPVLRKLRAHRGIDYAAPTGTRVRTTADGIVSFVGIRGGYGKLISVRHTGNKETLYGHLSGFAPGVRAGKRVSQGETLGYVGATGLATGPHLHYEFRVDGIHRNPLTVTVPQATPLPTESLPTFRDTVNRMRDQMAATIGWQIAKLD